MYALSRINPEYESETIVEVYAQVWNAREQRVIEDEYRLACWGGSNLMTGKPYIVFTPPEGIPAYSVKQERLYKVFLLAAHVHFLLTGEVDYRPSKVYDAYKIIYPEPGMPQTLPEFMVM
jgi:hypothetical protein